MSEFQKSVLKVMLVIGLFGICGMLVSGAIAEYAVKPVKEKIVRGALGSETTNCLLSELVRREQAQRAAASSNPSIKSMQSSLYLIVAGEFVVQLGLLYLCSCWIVRAMSRRSLNKLGEQSPGPATVPRSNL